MASPSVTSALLPGRTGATRLPAVALRPLPPGTGPQPVLHAARMSGQMSLPFLPAVTRSG